MSEQNKIKITKENIISCLISMRFDRVDNTLYDLVVENLLESGKFEIVDEEFSDRFNQLIELVHKPIDKNDNETLFYRLKEGRTIHSEVSYEDKPVKDLLTTDDNLLSYLVDINKINFIKIFSKKYDKLMEKGLLNDTQLLSLHELTVFHALYTRDEGNNIIRK